MPPQALSTKFTNAIDGLPEEVQLKLLKKHIATFLDSASEDAAKKTLQHVNKTKARYDSMPQIQFSTRRGEIQGLLNQIERDQKKSSLLPPGFLGVTVGPSSEEVSTRRDELLEEVIHTMTGWFQDIWSAVAEYNAGYSEAHASLIYCIKTIADILDAPPSRCKCATSLMTVKVAFQRRCSKPGKLVKRFSETGLEQIYTVIFWLWRELIVSAIANGSSTEAINEYLVDIEHERTWKSLQRVLNGGTALDECEDDFEDVEDDDGAMWLSDDSDYETAHNVNSSHDQRPKHWPARFKSAFPDFVDVIKARLQTVFSLEPSAELYQAIQAMPASSLSSSPETVRQELQVALDNVATSTTSTMLAALRIYSDQHLPDKLSYLLSSHSYLLRPHDFAIHQSAIKIMASDQRYVPQVLAIIEGELSDSIASIRYAVISCFSGIEKPRFKHELNQIMKLKSGTLDRKDMVERWVDSILTPGTAINGPMALAAVMMGVGLPFGGVTPMDLQDSDPLSFLDSETLNDPEYAPLREEHRPNLSDRLDGWIKRCSTLVKGPELLINMYKKTIDLIPWIRAPDIIDELVVKIGDRQTKHHLCDALESLNVFAKTQRRRILALHRKNKQAKDSAIPSSASFSRTTASTPSSSFTPPSQPPSSTGHQQHQQLPFPFGFQLPIPFNVNFAGDNVFTPNYDDEESDDDDGPPMLEPIGLTTAGPSAGPSSSAAYGMDLDDDSPPPLEPVGLSAPFQPAPAVAPPPPAPASQAFYDDEPPPLEPVTDSSDDNEDDYEGTDEGDEDEDEDEDDSDEDYGMPPPLILVHPATAQPLASTPPHPHPHPPPAPPHPQQDLPAIPPPGALPLLFPLLQGVFDPGVPGGGMNDVD